ncbi:MAG: signal peptide peptidase SppA [Stenotrophobium sp.]
MSESRSVPGAILHLAWTLVSGAYKLAAIVLLVLLAGMAWLAFSGGESVKIEPNSALVIWPTGRLVEQFDHESSRAFIESLAGNPPSETVLSDLTDALKAGAKDPRIKLVVLKLDDMSSSGMAQIQELGAAIRDFRKSGKEVVSYGSSYDQNEYYLAAQGDEIALDPMGMLNIEGFSAYNNYFKDALDKLGVQVNVFRVGQYKSAVEPFIRNDMSDAARNANRAWLGNLWQDYAKGISVARGLPAETVDKYVDDFSSGMVKDQGDAALYAMQSKLVTRVETLTQFRKRIGAIVGFDNDTGSFRQIDFHDYLRAIDHEHGKARLTHDTKVALVVVQGEIVDGNGDVGQAGGDMIVNLLEQAQRDDSVSAVVLRVDSPGGSVWASEQIRRAVDNLRAAGKPVVASMSSVAASGGYWISMDSNEIWAQPGTITGSIGIFGLIPTIDKPLAKLGIHTDGVGTTPLAGAFRIDRPLSPMMASIMQAQIDRGYREFTGGVAKARKLPLAKVETIAQGRVWSGEDAKRLELVDHFGGLDQAADAAAALAGIKPGSYDLETIYPERNYASQLFSLFSARIDLGLIPGLPEFAQRLLHKADLHNELSWLNDPQGMYARCLCNFDSGRE